MTPGRVKHLTLSAVSDEVNNHSTILESVETK
jgi:hypothetical protein